MARSARSRWAARAALLWGLAGGSALVQALSPGVSEAQTGAASVAASARSAGVLGPSLTRTTRIEDPGHKLDPFYAALDASARGKGITRIAWYGDSHVASDDYTGPLRALLQRRFGASGLGFVLPARVDRWYRRVGLSFSPPQGLRSERIRENRPSPALLGMYGIAIHADHGPAFTRFSTSASDPAYGASHLRLYYATRPDGGAISVTLDARAPLRVSTAGPDAGYGRLDLEAIDGAHSLEIRAEGDGPVTLYGAVLERDTPGVVLDMLGIPGARARSQLQWVRELRRDLLRERDPSLVVLAYGTNEAGDEDTLEGYVDGVRRVVGELRDDLPRAACLLVGPTDRPEKKGGKYLQRPRVQEITQRQRRLARELGCGFFDTQHFMGGPLSMRRWVRHRPQLGASDYVHLTPGGYEVLGAELFAALEHGYLTHGQRRRGK